MKYIVNRIQRLLKNTVILLAFVGIVAGLASFALITHFQDDGQTSQNTGCRGLCVALREDGMDPDNLAVKIGEYVQFNSADGKSHNISMGKGADGAEDDGHESHDAAHEHVGDYSSGDFKADEAWRVQFKKAGTYRLHDHYNPKLEILVVVYEPGADNKIR